MAKPIDPDILTVQEVAAYVHLHPITVYRMANSGALPAFRIGRNWRFKRQQIEQWLVDRPRNHRIRLDKGVTNEWRTQKQLASA